jgi:uncharacterized protein (DUF433 family)
MTRTPQEAGATDTREIYPGVTVNPRVMGGTPVLAGTRIPVGVIVGHLAAGDAIDTLMAEYRITDAQVRAALGYAAHLVTSSEVYASA